MSTRRSDEEAERERAAILHAFGNPLTAIRGYAEILVSRGDDRTRSAAEWILRAADEVSRLVEEVAGQVADAGAKAPPVEPATRAVGGRVLIVDDDPSIRMLVRATLTADTFQIVEAADGREAIDLIAASTPDLVVLDWNMPNVDGGEVLRAVRRDRPELPVVMLTAESDPSYREEAQRLGASLFLTKPFSPVELIGAVERLLA